MVGETLYCSTYPCETAEKDKNASLIFVKDAFQSFLRSWYTNNYIQLSIRRSGKSTQTSLKYNKNSYMNVKRQNMDQTKT